MGYFIAHFDTECVSVRCKWH